MRHLTSLFLAMLLVATPCIAEFENTPTQREDVAATDGEPLNKMGGIRDDAISADCADGDWCGVKINPLGAVAVGNVGESKDITTNFTVDTSEYASGDNIGGELSLSDAARDNIFSGVITNVILIDDGKEGTDIEVCYWHTNTTNATDQAPTDIADGDMHNLCGCVTLSDHVAFADNGMSQAHNVNIRCAGASTTWYAIITARAAVTFDAANAVSLITVIEQD